MQAFTARNMEEILEIFGGEQGMYSTQPMLLSIVQPGQQDLESAQQNLTIHFIQKDHA